jgi:hypothetical protein
MAENEEKRKTPPPEGKQPYRDKEAGMRHDAEPERHADEPAAPPERSELR